MSTLRRIVVALRSFFDKLEPIAVIEDAPRDIVDRRKTLEVVRESLAAYGIAHPEAANTSVAVDLASDYAVLGLTSEAKIEAVEAAWAQLARRADPKRFPEGSEESKRAAEILKKINTSYERIRESLNPTEGRFGKLEL